jgi:hypothetical protein
LFCHRRLRVSVACFPFMIGRRRMSPGLVWFFFVCHRGISPGSPAEPCLLFFVSWRAGSPGLPGRVVSPFGFWERPFLLICLYIHVCSWCSRGAMGSGRAIRLSKGSHGSLGVSWAMFCALFYLFVQAGVSVAVEDCHLQMVQDSPEERLEVIGLGANCRITHRQKGV